MSTMKRAKGPGPWCGTAGGYRNHGCKCDLCKAAHAAAQARYMAANEDRRLAHNERSRLRRKALKVAT